MEKVVNSQTRPRKLVAALIIACALAAMLMLSVVLIHIFADKLVFLLVRDVRVSELQYAVVDDTVTITKYKGNSRYIIFVCLKRLMVCPLQA